MNGDDRGSRIRTVALALAATLVPAQLARAAVPGSSTGGTTVPVISIQNPGNGTRVTGAYRLQVLVHSPDGTAITSVNATTNGTDPTCTAGVWSSPTFSLNSNYTGKAGQNAWVYEASMPEASGTQNLQVCARNGSGVVFSEMVQVVAQAGYSGDGNILGRDNASQVCADCHALQSHSSQSTGNKYGSWALVCRDCHQPHGTRNVDLVRGQITPPQYLGSVGAKTVVFRDRNTGDSGTSSTVSYVTSDPTKIAAGTFGPCQACHTRTQSLAGVARWRSTGNSDTHYAGAATQNCTGCHSHKDGFAAGESGGGTDCGSCHGDIFTPMSATSGSYHHYMNNAWSGNSAGSGTTTYPTAAWGGTSDTNRRCLACHVDHDLFRPDLDPGNGARAKNLRTDVALTPSSSTNFTNTDFDSALTNGGICLSCHRASQAKSYAQPDGTASTPVLDKAGYAASAHSYTAVATFRDDSTFNANCSKCHTDTQAKARQTSSAPNQFGLHDSALRRLSNPINDTIATGTATGTQSVNGVVDTTKTWTPGQYDGWNVTISDASGTRSNVILQTSTSTLTVETPWATAPVSGTTRYVIGEPAEERLCKQCHSGGVAGNDALSGRAMTQRSRRFDQYLRVYGTGAIAMTFGSSAVSGSGTSWYYSGSATFTGGNSTVTLSAPLANAASLVGWSIKYGPTTPPRWYTIVAAPSATQLVISPSYAEAASGTPVSGTYVVGMGDWYLKCDADTTGIWYRITDVTSATAATIYPQYGGAPCPAGSSYVARSSPGHPMASTAGLHKPIEPTSSGWNSGSGRHVSCADCHDPHKAAAGNHTPGATTTANLGAVSKGAWGVTPTYTFRTVTGGTFTIGSTSVTAPASTFTSADVGKNIIAPDGSALAIKGYVSGTTVTTTLYSGPTTSPSGSATFRVGDPAAAPTYAVVSDMTTANAQYQLCFKCHSSYGWGSTPPNTMFFTVTLQPTVSNGLAVPQTDTADDFNPFQFATHAIMERGHNQPPSTANPNWGTSAGRKANAPNTGLDNTFVDGWGAQSIVTCTDCHVSESGEDPWGPHGSANQWLLRGIEPNVTVTIAGGTVVSPNNCFYKGDGSTSAPGTVNTGDRRNLCLNCHRADVYGMVSDGGSSTGSSCNGGTTFGAGIPYQNLARVNHPVDGRPESNAVNKGALTRWGIFCMECHGGASIGAIHGTNEGYGTGGNSGSYRGKRFLNGATWSGHTRATTSAGVGCTTKAGKTGSGDAVNTCIDGARAASGNSANYDYESGAD